MQTLIQQIKSTDNPSEDIKRRVCDLLGMDELEYCQRQFDEGIAYLEHYIPDDGLGRDMLVASRTFWNWWRNHWEIRDMAYLRETLKKKRILAIALRVYDRLHNGAALCTKIHPGNAILENEYAVMMGKLIDENHKQ